MSVRSITIFLCIMFGAVMGLVFVVAFGKIQHLSYDCALAEMWFSIPVMACIGGLSGMIFATEDIVDINSRGDYPAYALSNLYQCPFYFNGIFCASREGLLQALKVSDVDEQIRLCSLSGYEAQQAGQNYNNWKENQLLHLQGEVYKRDSEKCQHLFKRIFDSENMSLDVVAAILSTHNKKLIQSIGKSDITDTVLTEQEFCLLMTDVRTQLKEKGLAYIG